MVRHVTYKGENYPVRISYYALAHCKEELGKDISESFEFENLEPLLFYSLIAGHKSEDKDMPFKREDIEFILDEVLQEFVKIVPEFFSQIAASKGGQTVVKKKK